MPRRKLGLSFQMKLYFKRPGRSGQKHSTSADFLTVKTVLAEFFWIQSLAIRIQGRDFLSALLFFWIQTMKQLQAAELFERLEPEIYDSILASLKRYSTSIGMLLFVNQDLSSERIGDTFVIVFGPDNTITSLKTIEENNGRCPVTPPGGGHHWQYFAEGWCPRSDMLEFLTGK